MVDYFYKSKKDPRDLNDELIKKGDWSNGATISSGLSAPWKSDLLIGRW
jgi:hypothetical protein